MCPFIRSIPATMQCQPFHSGHIWEMKQTEWCAISVFSLREHNGFETTTVDEFLQVLHRGTQNSSISFCLYCKIKNGIYWENKKGEQNVWKITSNYYQQNQADAALLLLQPTLVPVLTKFQRCCTAKRPLRFVLTQSWFAVVTKAGMENLKIILGDIQYFSIYKFVMIYKSALSNQIILYIKVKLALNFT